MVNKYEVVHLVERKNPNSNIVNHKEELNIRYYKRQQP
jgi:hypothetical protein